MPQRKVLGNTGHSFHRLLVQEYRLKENQRGPCIFPHLEKDRPYGEDRHYLQRTQVWLFHLYHLQP